MEKTSSVLESRRPARSIKLVDCDVHPTLIHWPRFLAHFAQRWRNEPLESMGARLLPAWDFNIDWMAGVRLDGEQEHEQTELEILQKEHLDAYQVDVGILIFYNLCEGGPRDLAVEGARAANDWQVSEFLDCDPRLKASMIVPWEHPELAVKEISRRVPEGHWVQVLSPGEPLESLGSPKYWPIYEAAAAYDLPIANHIGSGHDLHNGAGWPSFTFERHVEFMHSTRRQLMNVICEGVFEVVPGTRIVMVEGGVSWATSLRWALDSAFELLGSEFRLDRKPSEYLDTHVWYSTQPIDEPDDSAELGTLLELGKLNDRLLFASDYPHWDFDSPTQSLPRQFDNELREKIFAGNACQLYGFSDD